MGVDRKLEILSMRSKPQKILEPMLARERRAVSIIALVAMLRMFGLFALLPVLAIYAADLDGATPYLIGLAVGAYGLTQAALQLPFGALSDRIGRRNVVWLGLCIFAAGSLVAAYSDSIYWMIAGRFLQGAGAVSATLSALLADSTRPEVRTRSMAVLGIGIGSAFLLALILGPLIAAASGVRALFWLAALVAIVAGLLLTRVPETTVSRAAGEKRSLRPAFQPALLRLDAYIFVLHAMMTSLFVALPLLLRNELNMPLNSHWKVYVSALCVSLLGTVPLIIADERRGKPWVFSGALLLLLAGMLLIIFLPPSALVVASALALFFAGFNFLEAGLPARLSMLVEHTERGAAMGLFSSAQFLGAFAGGIISGLLMTDGAAQHVFVFAAVSAGLWLAAHVFFPARS